MRAAMSFDTRSGSVSRLLPRETPIPLWVSRFFTTPLVIMRKSADKVGYIKNNP